MTAAHSIYPPSFAPVGGRCSGAYRANQDAPERYSPESDEGTAAHWVASECLRMRCEPNGGNPVANFWIGEKAPNGVVIDSEITEAVQVYVDHVMRLCQETGGLRKLLIEHRVHAPQLHPENWGTLDTALFDDAKGVLYLVDYKHGHRYVPAVENLQLVNYVAGLINEMKFNGLDDQQITVCLQVVHPRCYHSPAGPVSEWRVKMSDLRPYFNQLSHKMVEAETSPTLTTGEHCRDCPGQLDCRAARLAGYRLFDYVRQPYDMDRMSTAHLAVEYDLLERGLTAARARFDAVAADLKHRLQNGDAAGSGKALQSTEGRRKWNVADAVVILTGQQFGIDARKPGVVTPEQFIKAAPPAMRTAVSQAVGGFSSRPPGELKIIDATDSITARAFTPTKPE
jgi:hypothetical protein